MQKAADDLMGASSEVVQGCLNTPNLLRDLILQLIKDFQTAQIPLPLDAEVAYSFEGLCGHLVQVIEVHLDKGGTLKNLLNRVDLTEKQIRKMIPNQLNAHLGSLAELIIKRELQKVVIRYWYRQTSENS